LPSHQNCKAAAVDGTRETRPSNLRGVSRTKSQRVGGTRVSIITLVGHQAPGLVPPDRRHTLQEAPKGLNPLDPVCAALVFLHSTFILLGKSRQHGNSLGQVRARNANRAERPNAPEGAGKTLASDRRHAVNIRAGEQRRTRYTRGGKCPSTRLILVPRRSQHQSPGALV
jgi:hypothetical protein